MSTCVLKQTEKTVVFTWCVKRIGQRMSELCKIRPQSKSQEQEDASDTEISLKSTAKLAATNWSKGTQSQK
jgi:hypothetical protein